MAAESILFGLAAGGASNALSEWHADKAQAREKDLMDYQNSLNRANALDAYRMQVQGMKMAGLNPALSNSSSPQAAAPVSKGSAPHAENVELDQSMGLLQAQKDNIEAQTAKTEAETAKIEGVDTKNVEADTYAKKAAAAFAGANTAKAEEETQRIKNINQVFQEENYSLPLFGQAMAQEWQKTGWYNELGKVPKMVIDDIADGKLDLSIGLASALERSIAADSRMSEVQNNKVQYALTRSVIEGQMKSPKVMDALVKTPQAQYGEVIARASQLGAETGLLRFDLDWKKDQKDVWTRNDPDKLYAEYQKDPTVENAAKWLVGSIRSTGADVVKSIAPAAIHGSLLGGATKRVEKHTETTQPPIYGSDGSILKPKTTIKGVESFFSR